MELFFYYGLFCIITALAFYAASRRHAARRHLGLTPEVILVASFFLYTSAMPVSRIFWGSEPRPNDLDFMQAHLLANFGLLAGIVGAKLFRPPAVQNTLVRPLPSRRCVILSLLTLFGFAFYIYSSVGYQLGNMLKPYTFETTLGENTTLDTLMEPIAFAMILHCYLSARRFRKQNPNLHRFVIVAAGVMALLLLLRGMRNPAQILILPIFALIFQNRRIPIFRASIVVAGVFVLFSVIAIVRNYGILSADRATIDFASIDPIHGELGTSYNVFSIFNTMSYDEALQYGRTYSVDLGVNLVPHAIWPNRPPSTAIRFSRKYYGTEDLTQGLGFSPVVEALSNFPMPFIPIVFAVFAAGTVLISHFLLGHGRWGLLSWAMLMPMIINWNRIDSSAASKMFSAYVLFFFLYDKLIYLRTGR